jgi:hypothetical protein
VSGAFFAPLHLNRILSKRLTTWRAGDGHGIRNANAIDAVLKVKSNMDSGMFYGISERSH